MHKYDRRAQSRREAELLGIEDGDDDDDDGVLKWFEQYEHIFFESTITLVSRK